MSQCSGLFGPRCAPQYRELSLDLYGASLMNTLISSGLIQRFHNYLFELRRKNEQTVTCTDRNDFCRRFKL